MKDLWNPEEQRAVESHLAAAVIGGPATVGQKLRDFLQATEATELILHSDFYWPEDRFRSYEIVADQLLTKQTK
jgi:alkanesulfonate monooxygenase SsuD/methylene tetrahydromethanopterin reductase-like flavin-dependent oxidoreductase (luciferase family)